MKRVFKFLLVLIFTFSVFLLISTEKTLAGWVNGYWKKDGTYVPGYWRSNPNGLKYDNYSFDGNWADAYNDSFFSPTKNYSSEWYSPSWFTQNDYWIEKNFFDSRKSYRTYNYNLFDYDYNFWNDPVYNYDPLYDYGWKSWDYKPKSYFKYDFSYPKYKYYDYNDYLYNYDSYEYFNY